MEERKGDATILIISGLMFLCVVAGGLLLCLYLFVPESESQDWYSVVGIILVSTPWIFWFLVYLYHCLKPIRLQSNAALKHSSSSNRPPSAANNSGGIVANLPQVESPDCDTPGDGKRRVHFGAVVVKGNNPQGGKKSSHDSSSKELRSNESGATSPTLSS
ncbi:uncharacterized protein LOC111494867 [Cucurbita maxima]|uniref:Uncharacterized protein LOC111494867 n=1 Tax=Cucurbita maxima TaxID=3661 RepID=A0A6J1KKI3_CUCMA|nr:uncharacterized protein LOC111494867 [Cucurbita maxima]